MKFNSLLFNSKIMLISLFLGIILLFVSCDNAVDPDDEAETPDSLYVQFNNDPSSVVTITSIMVQANG